MKSATMELLVMPVLTAQVSLMDGAVTLIHAPKFVETDKLLVVRYATHRLILMGVLIASTLLVDTFVLEGIVVLTVETV